jgi:hypothetical protein
LDGDRPERRLYAVAPRRAEDRHREDLTDVFRMSWEHGVNGQAQVIKGMQQIIHSYTLVQDKEALSEAVANVRWLIAAGIRDFHGDAGEAAQAPKRSPPRRPGTRRAHPRRLGCLIGATVLVGVLWAGRMRTPAVRVRHGTTG